MPVSPRTRALQAADITITAQNVISKAEKVQYVKSQGQTRDHHCHWPGCCKNVPPAMWGCYGHWMKLPDHLRNRVWEDYRPGQEVNMTPSRDYIVTVMEVEAWIKTNYRCAACEGTGKSSKQQSCTPCNGSGVKQ